MSKRPLQTTAEAVDHFRQHYIKLVKQTGLCVRTDYSARPILMTAGPKDRAEIEEMRFVKDYDGTKVRGHDVPGEVSGTLSSASE